MFKYEEGQTVLYRGLEAKIQNRSVNINGMPVYQINNVWVSENELMLPPPIF